MNNPNNRELIKYVLLTSIAVASDDIILDIFESLMNDQTFKYDTDEYFRKNLLKYFDENDSSCEYCPEDKTKRSCSERCDIPNAFFMISHRRKGKAEYEC